MVEKINPMATGIPLKMFYQGNLYYLYTDGQSPYYKFGFLNKDMTFVSDIPTQIKIGGVENGRILLPKVKFDSGRVNNLSVSQYWNLMYLVDNYYPTLFDKNWVYILVLDKKLLNIDINFTKCSFKMNTVNL